MEHGHSIKRCVYCSITKLIGKFVYPYGRMMVFIYADVRKIKIKSVKSLIVVIILIAIATGSDEHH